MKNMILVFLLVFVSRGFAQIEYNTIAELKVNTNIVIKNNIKPELQLNSEQPERKSLGKAFFYSLLLPGLGESYVGNSTYAKIFLSLEAIGWGFYLGNYQHVSWLQSDYKNFARQHANINRQSKDDQYWIDIGKYDNIYEYNEQRRRDRDVLNIYDENTRYYWQWDSQTNRLNYDGKRIHAKSLENDDVYYLGAIVLNHIVSAINALRLAKAYNNDIKQIDFMMGVNFNRYSNSLSLSLGHNF